MTNGEKCKTAHERAVAFNKFCKMECDTCKCNKANGGICNETPYEGTFAWLDLEADEEKPLLCPFCGNNDIRFLIVEDASDQYMACPEIICSRCGAMFELDWHLAIDLGATMTEEHKRQLLAKWNNRVAKDINNKEESK